MTSFREWASETIPPIAVFVAIDLVLTLLLFFLGNVSVRIGTFRPVTTIPLKLAELVAIGVAIGLVASAASRKLDLSLVTLGVAFVVLLDLDHLPSAIGITQPIRPAHSFAFLALTVIVMVVAIRGRPEVEAIVVASFLGHLSADTGVFALLAPFSFQYLPIDDFRILLVATAVLLAILAGFVKRHRTLEVVPLEVRV